jgi:hypothetical protein
MPQTGEFPSRVADAPVVRTPGLMAECQRPKTLPPGSVWCSTPSMVLSHRTSHRTLDPLLCEMQFVIRGYDLLPEKSISRLCV